MVVVAPPRAVAEPSPAVVPAAAAPPAVPAGAAVAHTRELLEVGVVPAPRVASPEDLPRGPAHRLDVHEIALPPPGAVSAFELPAGGPLEVRDGAELPDDRAPFVEAPLHPLQRCLRLLLLPVLGVDVPRKVVPEVVTDAEVHELPELGELLEDVLVEVLVMLLLVLGVLRRAARPRPLVQVHKHDRRRRRGPVVLAGAAVPVSARPARPRPPQPEHTARGAVSSLEAAESTAAPLA